MAAASAGPDAEARSARDLRQFVGVLCVAMIAVHLGAEGVQARTVRVSIPDLAGKQPPQAEVACLLVVQRSIESAWPDPAVLSALLQSSGIADIPAGQLLEITPELRAQKIRFQINPLAIAPEELTLSVRVTFDLPPESPPHLAREYVAVVIDRFKDALADLRDQRSSQINLEVQAKTEELAATDVEMARIKSSLREIDVKAGMKPSSSLDLRSEPGRTRSEITMVLNFLESYRREEQTTGLEAVQAAWRQVAQLLDESVLDLHGLLKEEKVDLALVTKFEERLEEARSNGKPGIKAGKGGYPASPRLASDKITRLEQLLDRLQELEKVDVRGLAAEMEALERESQRLGNKRDALAAQLEKVKSALKGLSRVSVETVGR